MSSPKFYPLLDSLSKAQETITILQDELTATNQEVMQLTLDLEQRVADRTEELTRTNNELLREIKERRRAEKEVLQLNSSLIQHAKQVEAINKELERTYDTIRRDLQAAAAMQLRLLPRKLEIEERAKLDWFMLPSSYLAGDMLGYFLVDSRHLVFYLLDVAGHGIPAALLSVTLNRMLTPASGSSLLHVSSEIRDQHVAYYPSEITGELNRRFQSMEEDEYFTILYAICDLETGEVRFCQAGHPAPLHITVSGNVVPVGEGGFPVGLWPEMTYEESVVQLASGERLVLYSDGITECQNLEATAYGIERLSAVLQRNARSPLSTLVNAVREDVSQWHGTTEFSDDVSLLVIERP